MIELICTKAIDTPRWLGLGVTGTVFEIVEMVVEEARGVGCAEAVVSWLMGVVSGRNLGCPHRSSLLCRALASSTSDVMTQEALDHRIHLVRYFQLVEVSGTDGPAIHNGR